MKTEEQYILYNHGQKDFNQVDDHKNVGGKTLSLTHTHAPLKHPGMQVNSVYYGFDNKAANILTLQIIF